MIKAGFRILAKVVDENKKIIGYRIIHLGSLQIKSASVNEAINFIGKRGCDNAALLNGEIVGTESSMDRLPNVSTDGRIIGESRLVVLEAVYNWEDLESIKLMDAFGRVESLKGEEGLTLLNTRGAVNARLVEKGGKIYLHAIKGSLNKVHNERKREAGEIEIRSKLLGIGLEEYAEFNEKKGRIERYLAKGKKGNSRVITDLVIPDTISGYKVRVIGKSVFRHKGLESVIIPEGIEEIGRFAFAENKLRKVVIPKSVRIIGENPFYGNKGLFIEVHPENEEYKSIGGDLYSKNGEVLISGGNKGIQEGTREIGGYAFMDWGVTEIEIPESVSEIGIAAFLGNKLKSVKLPKNLSRLNKLVFRNNRLESIDIPYGVKEICDNALSYNKLTRVTIESGTRIGKSAFEGNMIERLVIPEGVTEIGESAFVGNKIKQVKFPETLESIGYRAFNYNNIGSLKIPRNVKTIYDGAFEGNEIQTLEIEEGLEWIGDTAFQYNWLEEVILPESVKSVGRLAFGNNKIRELKLSSNIRLIKVGAFQGNELKKLELAEGLEVIGVKAFSGNKLREIVIPKSVNGIGSGAFEANMIEKVEIRGELGKLSAELFKNNGADSRSDGLKFEGSGNYILEKSVWVRQ